MRASTNKHGYEFCYRAQPAVKRFHAKLVPRELDAILILMQARVANSGVHSINAKVRTRDIVLSHAG